MMALSVREPYATQIARRKKRIENRTWGEKVRGPVALHRCGKGGAIIGVMEIERVITAKQARIQYPKQAEYISGPLCWVIKSFRKCDPIPCKGKLKLWKCEAL